MRRHLLATVVAAVFMATASPALADTDGDGHEPPFDCNDNDSQVYPGAFEIVGDSTDQDCDGDEICYVDADNDDTRSTSTAGSTDSDCFDAFEGRVADPVDCNDGDPSISPLDSEVVGDGTDQDCDGGETCYGDGDNDGARNNLSIPSSDVLCTAPGEAYAAQALDCNDSNDTIHPGAVEFVGNETDEDCDGHEVCFLDEDDDGARLTTTTGSTDEDCDDTDEAAVSDPIDCDDSDPGVFPGGTEVCDIGDRDEDCDGDADDADPDASAATMTPWYEDADGDGYGSSSSSLMRCDQPVGHVGNDGDCDDGDSSISPGDPEICDAANEDEDCDGLADDSDTAVGGVSSWYSDVDGDGYGATGSPPQIFCDAPPSHVGNDGDCDDTDASVYPPGLETCDPDDPKDYNCDGNVACADPTCSSAPGCTTEVFDHMECFKVKTTEKLKATLDLNPGTNAPFQLAEGCRIGKAAKICVPIMRPVYDVDPSSTLTENPLYEGQAMEQESICYKVKCPSESPPLPPSVALELLDHFGSRSFTKVKVSEICAPAEIVP